MCESIQSKGSLEKYNAYIRRLSFVFYSPLWVRVGVNTILNTYFC